MSKIREREVMLRFEYEISGEEESSIDRLMDFYNNDILHTVIGYIAPRGMNIRRMEENKKA